MVSTRRRSNAPPLQAPPLQEENVAPGAQDADAPLAALLDGGAADALDDVDADDADDADAPPAALVADAPAGAAPAPLLDGADVLGDADAAPAVLVADAPVPPPADVVPPADVMPPAVIAPPAALVVEVAVAEVVVANVANDTVMGAAADAVAGACAAAVANIPAIPDPPHWLQHHLFAEVAWGFGACVWVCVAALSTMASRCIAWAWQLLGAAAALACTWVAWAWHAIGAGVLLRQWLVPLALAGGALCYFGPWALATFSLCGFLKTLAANAGLKKAAAAAQAAAQAAARDNDRRAARAAEAARESVNAAEAQVARLTIGMRRAQDVIEEVGGFLSDALPIMMRGDQATDQMVGTLRAVVGHLGRLPADDDE